MTTFYSHILPHKEYGIYSVIYMVLTQQDRSIQRRRPDDRYSDDGARRTKYQIGQWLSGVNSLRSKCFRACLLRKVQVKRSLLFFPYLDLSFTFLNESRRKPLLRELRRKCTQPVKRAGNYREQSSTGIYRRELIKQPRQRRQWKTSLLKKRDCNLFHFLTFIQPHSVCQMQGNFTNSSFKFKKKK